MAPTIKLTYFPIAGRAEAIRHTFAIGKIPFEDAYVTFDTFAEVKKGEMLPFKSLPIMDVDGEVYAESGAMLRFAGKLAGLYPKCDKAAMKVDMVADALESVLTAVFKDSSEESRKKVLAETFPRYYGAIDKMYAATKGPYLLGETLSIADVKVASFVGRMNAGGILDHIPAGCLEKYPHLMAATKSVHALDAVKEYNAKEAAAEKN